MDKKQQALDLLFSQKILPLYYHDSAEVSTKILEALYDAGIRAVEYTNRGEAALDNFQQLRKAVDERMPGLLLGVGTIKTKKAAGDFVDAGADFVICPSLNTKVGKLVSKAGLLWVPGCMTATEIARAENAGATLVKIFPGNILGPSYITAIKDIFPGLRFVVTGGVEAEEMNLRSWFSVGVAGVGLGSKLISKELIERQDYEGLKEATQRALALVKDIA
ncbi:bifunctional 4-hydroxy-2-oxoglutarate aldolase/2-dehydro-3-deoxy-phosphogluconate aldolase [Flavisolibacter nicotianae]|uniref:bifunctional 4-hydroxy-2-oxoglutarate aldolase/2-dehydro-3-deoxy-phosphogluconate aldolase n=1 Tax=Flavisolibacter nicotianae TaxID=2364882 RepID=UPI000EAE73FC|nr:bifunctional 4-hydroxy-2-oxoglutarate aldolase/2-dehydro-3-deoxy-phosphogluconate aldolase [Flavisolibacter nicotianae]